jgi:uncharacterized protein YbcC (UPF0753/DUF2309 family)
MNLNGWTSYAAKRDYEAKLDNLESTIVLEVLTVLTSWELCTFLALRNKSLTEKQKVTVTNFKNIEASKIYSDEIQKKIILQEALNFSVQRKKIAKFNFKTKNTDEVIPSEIQAVFCIDVRSEIYRRNLEQTNSSIQTLGFAGFLGFPVNFFGMGKQTSKVQIPALLIPKLNVIERIKNNTQNNKILHKFQLEKEILNLWKTFKSGSISCFVFVSPLGITLYQ